MDLSIIIVNWNSKAYLKKCLASIVAQTSGLEYEIIVIDAASFDGCGEMLQEDYPRVRFIQSQQNLGFARANNAAFRESVGGNILFLNPDTELAGPAINALHRQLRTLPRVGVLGARLLNTDGTIQISCIQSFPTILNQALDSEFLRRRFPRSHLWGMSPLFSTGNAPSPVEAVSGACMMLPRAAFESVGCFSEDYFMYSEDVDLSYKLIRGGLQNYYVPSACAIHHGGGSTSAGDKRTFSDVMYRESRWRMFRKNRGLIYAAGYRLSMGVSAALRIGYATASSLVAAQPTASATSRRTLSKWHAILRWAIGLEKWTGDF